MSTITTDPIADLLVRIKNAGMAGKESVSMPYSRVKHAILSLLQQEGYIQGCEVSTRTPKTLEVTLAYTAREIGMRPIPRISDVTRISKPSKRIYRGVDALRPVRFGRGLLVLSTPKGILSGKAAREANVGGEALFEIW